MSLEYIAVVIANVHHLLANDNMNRLLSILRHTPTWLGHMKTMRGSHGLFSIHSTPTVRISKRVVHLEERHIRSLI